MQHIKGSKPQNFKQLIYEMKSSEIPRFTDNQVSAGYKVDSLVLSDDYIVVGKNGGEYWTGQIIPAGTTICIIKP